MELKELQRNWDILGKEDPLWAIISFEAKKGNKWDLAEFFASGERTVAEEILTDMGNICQGKAPGEMRVLEIGCGAGRVTRAFAKLFGEVHAVDVSGEMVRLATETLREFPKAFVYQNNGKDLAVVPNLQFDFAFSSIVFQHIPSREIIENYVGEVQCLLRPGGLFKFQVQGDSTLETKPDDTWLGAPFSERQAVDMAFRCGFDPRYRHGAGEQYFWLWFFKR